MCIRDRVAVLAGCAAVVGAGVALGLAQLAVVGAVVAVVGALAKVVVCLLYTSPSPRDRTRSRMPSFA